MFSQPCLLFHCVEVLSVKLDLSAEAVWWGIQGCLVGYKGVRCSRCSRSLARWAAVVKAAGLKPE